MASFLTIVVPDSADAGDTQGPVPSAMAKYLELLGPISGQRTPSVWVGHQVENPNTVQAMINLDVQNDKLQQALQEHGTSMNSTTSLLVDKVSGHDAGEALSAPVTELVTVSFIQDPPAPRYREDLGAFCRVLGSAAGCVGRAYGLTRETIATNGGEGYAALLMIGWTSVEAHLRFKATPVWTENIHLVRAPGASIEMHHVEFAHM
ncbi:Hypothetical predicted protein [Lecanosticta acicola]|uniref:ABM domain-containing protein n=1 Tax=Lecanosticta acicola TaxID=111012 RepID=A0AAI8YYZ9_9PEZI|nr:Hypothetical predicted protein [Lecanosticta acicola]